jgi:predicted permease
MAIFSWLKRRRLDDEDFQDEIRAHLTMAANERMADGQDPESARLASLKEFGNLALTSEAARRVWTPGWLDVVHDIVSDARYAIRGLRKHAGFSLTVIAVLTVGIGLNAAAFTMLKSMALSPIAGVPRSAQLFDVSGTTDARRNVYLSYPDYTYLRDHDQAFSGLFGSIVSSVGLGGIGNARPIWTELVTGNYFEVLGVDAQRGRTLRPSDEIAPGRHPVAVISDGLWHREFGADPAIVGKVIRINNFPLTVVGVAHPDFHGTIVGYDVELFVPVMTAPDLGFALGGRRDNLSAVFFDRRVPLFDAQGFLRPGVTIEKARTQTEALWAALSRDRPAGDPNVRISVVPFRDAPGTAPTYLLPTLLVLSATGLLVLMIACANIAGLVLVRGLSRRGEIAVRLALGASRARILRMLIVENIVLALPGAAFGLWTAWISLPVLIGYGRAMAAPQLLFLNTDVDLLVLGFVVLVACGSALVFGFVPALHSSRMDLVSVLKDDLSPRGAGRGRLRAALVIAQVAVSLLLLIGAGLMMRSLDAARRANPGFDPNHVAAVSLDVKQNGYDEPRGRAFYARLLESARTADGTGSASLAAWEPLRLLDTAALPIAIDGYAPGKNEDMAFQWNTVGADFFRTLRIPVLAGREFAEPDDDTGTPVAVVNRTLAERFWGAADGAIGKRIRIGERDWRTIVGVAADVKYARIDESPRPYVYVPFAQWYRPTMTVFMRGPEPDAVLVDRARARVNALDADLPILSANAMTARIGGSLMFMRLAAAMLFVFGASGMTLAALGTYGLVSYVVKQSTHEIGIRMALGAPRFSIVRDFLARGLRLGAVGAAIGIVIALGVTRLLTGLLYGVTATDAVSFARAVALVFAVVAVATLVPAWRAARTDPLTALRHQQ